MSEHIISLKGVTKEFDTKNGKVVALRDINLDIDRGDSYGSSDFPAQESRLWSERSIFWSSLLKARCCSMETSSPACQERISICTGGRSP